MLDFSFLFFFSSSWVWLPYTVGVDTINIDWNKYEKQEFSHQHYYHQTNCQAAVRNHRHFYHHQIPMKNFMKHVIPIINKDSSISYTVVWIQFRFGTS